MQASKQASKLENKLLNAKYRNKVIKPSTLIKALPTRFLWGAPAGPPVKIVGRRAQWTAQVKQSKSEQRNRNQPINQPINQQASKQTYQGRLAQTTSSSHVVRTNAKSDQVRPERTEGARRARPNALLQRNQNHTCQLEQIKAINQQNYLVK